MNKIDETEIGCFCIAGAISLLLCFANKNAGIIMSSIVIIAIIIKLFEIPEILKRIFRRKKKWITKK